MRQPIPDEMRAGAVALEGFNLRTLAEYLAHLSLSNAQLRTIASMIAIGGGCDVFAAPSSGDPPAEVCACLVDGRSRTIVVGSGQALTCFVEGERERLVFFPRPGRAGSATLKVEARSEDSATTWQATLTRGEDYRYFLDGQWIQVSASTRDLVRCEVAPHIESQPSHINLLAEAFWPFVFATSPAPQALFLAQMSAAHTAALLGLSLLTIQRRIGEGRLPAVRLRSKYPGVCLSGLREFLAYRRRFPQGHPDLGRIEAWQREWREAYRREVIDLSSRATVGMPNSFVRPAKAEHHEQ